MDDDRHDDHHDHGDDRGDDNMQAANDLLTLHTLMEKLQPWAQLPAGSSRLTAFEQLKQMHEDAINHFVRR